MTQAFHRPLLRTRQFCFRLSAEEELGFLQVARARGLDASNMLRLLLKEEHMRLQLPLLQASSETADLYCGRGQQTEQASESESK